MMVGDRLVNHCKTFSLRNSHQGQALWYFCLLRKDLAITVYQADQAVTDNLPRSEAEALAHWVADCTIFTPHSVESNAVDRAGFQQ